MTYQIPEDARKEIFQRAFLEAMVAPLGIEVKKLGSDYSCTDLELEYFEFLDGPDNCPSIRVQLKATKNLNILKDGKTISFSMPNRLRRQIHKLQAKWLFVFILHLPESSEEWFLHSEDNEEAKLKHKMYWVGLENIPKPADDEPDDEYKSIHFPRSQVVDQLMIWKMLKAKSHLNRKMLYEKGGNEK